MTSSTQISQSPRSNSEGLFPLKIQPREPADMDKFLLLQSMFSGTSHSPEDTLLVFTVPLEHILQVLNVLNLK